MKVLDVHCSHCQARIDVAVGTRFDVCAFCGAQLEFSEAQERALDPVPVTVRVVQVPARKPSQVEESELAGIQAEITSLDEAWDADRKNLLVSKSDGSTHVPDVGYSVAIGMAIILAGLVWTLIVGTLAQSRGYSKWYTVSGVLFIYFAVQILARGIRRAQRYEDAFHKYRDRRIDLQRSRGGG